MINGPLADISEVQCWENNVVEAVATAREIASADGRCAALTNIARIRVRDGDPGGAVQPFALALESAEAIPDDSRRAPALAEIAEIQLDAIADCAPGVNGEPGQSGVRALSRAGQKGS